MLLLVLGLAIFIVVHLLPTRPDLRARAIARLGEGPYKATFTAFSALGLVLIVYGFGMARDAGPVQLWYPPVWTKHLVMTLMLPVFPLLIGAYLDGYIKAKLKHPMLVAVKLWALAHLIANGSLADLLLFGGILAWAVLARISLKRRGKVGGTATPNVRADLIAVVAGLAIYGLFVWRAHLWIAGRALM